MYSARNGNLEMAKLLIEHGAQVQHQDIVSRDRGACFDVELSAWYVRH